MLKATNFHCETMVNHLRRERISSAGKLRIIDVRKEDAKPLPFPDDTTCLSNQVLGPFLSTILMLLFLEPPQKKNFRAI